MKKQERQELVKKLLDDSIEHGDIVIKVVSESGATEATVRKDIAELSTPEEDNETSEKVIKITLTADEKENKQLAKGRVTEYTVPTNEEDIVHVEIEKTSFASRGKGGKKSIPTVQKFDKRAWLQFRKNAHSLGYDHVRVLYAPSDMREEDLKVVVPEAPKEEK